MHVSHHASRPYAVSVCHVPVQTASKIMLELEELPPVTMLITSRQQWPQTKMDKSYKALVVYPSYTSSILSAGAERVGRDPFL